MATGVGWGGPGINVAPARQYLLPGFSRPMGFATEDEAKAWLKQTYTAEPEEVALRRFQYDMRQNWAGRWVLRHDPELWWFTRLDLATEGRHLRDLVTVWELV